MGKFSKVAQGVMMVHSKSAPVDFEFLAHVAAEAGANDEKLARVNQTGKHASQVGDLMSRSMVIMNFFQHLCQYCCLSAIRGDWRRDFD